jgi:hypothetical protein
VACSDDSDWYPSCETLTDSGHLDIDIPTRNDTWDASIGTIHLSGSTFRDAAISWRNEASRASGAALVGYLEQTNPLCGCPVRLYRFGADVPLIDGDNRITLTAAGCPAFADSILVRYVGRAATRSSQASSWGGD